MCRPPPPRIRLSTNQRRTRHVRQRRHLAITQRRINMLALSRLRPGQQRRHDRIRRIQPRRQIRHSHPNLHRWAVPRAGDVHQAHLGLDHDVVAGAFPVRARLAVAGDAGVDEAWIDFAQGVVVHVVFLEGAGDVVFDEDVAVFDEFVEDGDAGGVGEGQGNGFLVAVDLDVA